MKVVVCKDEDADALITKMRLKHKEIGERFGAQDQRSLYVVNEVMRAVHFELVSWLQAQGFKVT